MAWIYESHTGGLFWLDTELSIDDCYCDSCGDYDWEIGCFESMADFVKEYADNIIANLGEGGYDIDLIIDNIGGAFNDELTRDEIKEIVIANKTYEDEDYE